MKNLILTLIAINFCLTGFSQERIQKKRKLNNYLTELGRFVLVQADGKQHPGEFKTEWRRRESKWMIVKDNTSVR